MPRQSTKDPQTPWGQYVQRVMDERGLNSRSQHRLTGIGHSTVNDWLDDHQPSRSKVIEFAQGFGRDVNEALQMAGFAPLPSPSTVAAMMEQRQAQESPKDRLERRVKEAAGALSLAGFTVPPLGMGSHAGHYETDEEADVAYERWLVAVEKFNPGKELPEGLRGEE